jgi:hypothetical protein
MLRDHDVIATIAVKDIEVATGFYEGTLGLELRGSEMPSVRAYRSGASTVLVYESGYAGTNRATAATRVVGKRKVAWFKDPDGNILSMVNG